MWPRGLLGSGPNRIFRATMEPLKPDVNEFEIAPVPVPDRAHRLAARTLVRERLRGMGKMLDRRFGPVDVVLRPAPPEIREHLVQQACELYQTELGWEEWSGEEELGSGGELVPMVFPALLDFVAALLPIAPNGEPDRDKERRDVAHFFLEWLGARLVALRERHPEDDLERGRIRRAEALTDRLIDYILFRLCSLNKQEIDLLAVWSRR